MMSDNASTYLAAADKLHELLESTFLKQALEDHDGGFWEALKKTLGRSFVTLPIFETIVVEVEATLND